MQDQKEFELATFQLLLDGLPDRDAYPSALGVVEDRSGGATLPRQL
jgi:hypothetical protein